MFNKHDISRNACQLYGGQAKCGYDWWWHSFTAHHAVTGEEKPFFIEFFLCNPELGEETPVFSLMITAPYGNNESAGKTKENANADVKTWVRNFFSTIFQNAADIIKAQRHIQQL